MVLIFFFFFLICRGLQHAQLLQGGEQGERKQVKIIEIILRALFSPRYPKKEIVTTFFYNFRTTKYKNVVKELEDARL